MNDRTKELLANLEDGIDSMTSSDKWQDYLATAAKFHRYSFGNTLLIMFQDPFATQVAGFRKWQELGRQVRKGEKAIWILAPLTVRDRDSEAEAGDGQRRVKLIGWKSVPVFDVAQTDGEPLPEPVKLLDGDHPEDMFERLTEVALSLGITSVTDADLGSANGVVYGDGRVEIHPDRPGLQRAKSLAHEIAHWQLGHCEQGNTLTRGTRELEAESAAYVVMASLGIDTSDYSFGYVAGWAGGDDADKARAGIKASAGRIQKAATVILDALAAVQPQRELAAA